MAGKAERDTETVDGVIRALYAAISFPDGGKPDWERESRIFPPEARMTRMSEEGMQTFTLAEYRANFERMQAEESMPGFHELEIARKTLAYGDLVHVWSSYEAKRSPESAEVLFRGINSLQIVRRSGRWQILSAVWFREGRSTPIPGEFL
jgi:hypothetical protein